MPQLGDTVGRYTLQARLGAGGMGEVYRAADPQLRRSVALKLLLTRPGDDPSARAEWTARMIREARAAAAFDHPNAVTVYDVGEHDGAPFIVMELVPGRSLKTCLGDASLSVAERLRWLADAARALGAGHRAGLVHRDVKPDNIMVRDDGVVKILDFGIARQAARPADTSAPTAAGGLETLTRTGATVGTPVYMAPEQLKLLPLDGRADQFSWAVTAFHLLAGRRPWEAEDVMALAIAVASEDPPRLRSLRPEVPEAVDAVIARALSKRPEDRFATMEEVAAAIDPSTSTSGASSAPVAARPAGEVRAPASPPVSPPTLPGARRRGLVPIVLGAAVVVVGTAGWVFGRRAPDPAPAARASAPASAPASSAPSTSAVPPPPPSASAAPAEPPLRQPCVGISPDAGIR